MTKILILGSTGMLGHMVFKVLSREKDWEVKGVSSKEFDAALEIPDVQRYDYVINCVGVLAGGDETKMDKINAEFPRRLAKATKAKIIHISTDGVFSGKGGSYNEDSPADAADPYGKSKLAGEVNAPNVLNIRTSIIGPSPNKKKGLLEWFLSQPDGATVQGFTNHTWHGITTLQYAKLCVKIIKQDVFDRLRQESHVFHFAPNGPVTKYGLLNLFKKAFGKNITINPVEDSKGAVKRILTTKCNGLKKLFKHDIKMEEAINKLIKFV